MPVSKASKQVGVSYDTLRKWIKESGLTREDEESETLLQRNKGACSSSVRTRHSSRWRGSCVRQVYEPLRRDDSVQQRTHKRHSRQHQTTCNASSTSKRSIVFGSVTSQRCHAEHAKSFQKNRWSFTTTERECTLLLTSCLR